MDDSVVCIMCMYVYVPVYQGMCVSECVCVYRRLNGMSYHVTHAHTPTQYGDHGELHTRH